MNKLRRFRTVAFLALGLLAGGAIAHPVDAVAASGPVVIYYPVYDANGNLIALCPFPVPASTSTSQT